MFQDGYQLKGESKTTCVYGNWTGLTPSCEEMYCPFPGYLDNGKILLVGNMGLYDYRPYVRKITNNRQIIFDCDKGWRLALGSAEGATCIGISKDIKILSFKIHFQEDNGAHQTFLLV